MQSVLGSAAAPVSPSAALTCAAHPAECAARALASVTPARQSSRQPSAPVLVGSGSLDCAAASQGCGRQAECKPEQLRWNRYLGCSLYRTCLQCDSQYQGHVVLLVTSLQPYLRPPNGGSQRLAHDATSLRSRCSEHNYRRDVSNMYRLAAFVLSQCCPRVANVAHSTASVAMACAAPSTASAALVISTAARWVLQHVSVHNSVLLYIWSHGHLLENNVSPGQCHIVFCCWFVPCSSPGVGASGICH
jgi:hypothetical protein